MNIVFDIGLIQIWATRAGSIWNVSNDGRSPLRTSVFLRMEDLVWSRSTHAQEPLLSTAWGTGTRMTHNALMHSLLMTILLRVERHTSHLHLHLHHRSHLSCWIIHYVRIWVVGEWGLVLWIGRSLPLLSLNLRGSSWLLRRSSARLNLDLLHCLQLLIRNY